MRRQTEILTIFIVMLIKLYMQLKRMAEIESLLIRIFQAIF
nr:hypothetical protein [Carnobacterium mobile]